MKTGFKTALLAALGLAGIVATAAPAAAQGIGLSFGPRGGVTFSYDSGGYCDAWGCPDAFWDMPVYYGSVFYNGGWYNGPVYYRDWYGRRQFWVHGGWRYDEWRGPRPSWYRTGRYGAPLGMNYYRDNGFHGRWDRDRFDNRGNRFDNRYDNRNDNRNDNRFGNRGNDRRDYRDMDRRNDNRGDNNRGDNNRNDNNRGDNNNQRPPQAQPQQQAQPAPQAQPQQQGRPDRGTRDNNGDWNRQDRRDGRQPGR